MAIISRLAVVLGLDAGQFSANLGKADTALVNFANKAKSSATTIGAIGAAMGAIAYKAIEFADALHDVAKANDMSIASVIKLNQALTLNGGKAEDSGKMLASFTNKIDEAAQGSDKVRKTFAELGITLDDLAKLSQQELFEKAISQLATMNDQVRMNAVSMDLFGKSVKTLDIKGFSEDLKNLESISKETENGILDSAKSADVLARSWGKLQASASGGLGESILWLSNKFEKLVDLFVKADEKFRKFTASLFGGGKAQAESKFTPMSGGQITPDILKSSPIVRKIEESEKEKSAREKLQSQIESQQNAYQQQLKTLQLQTAEIGKQQSTAAKLALEFEKGGRFEKLTAAQKEKMLKTAEEYDLAVKLNKVREIADEQQIKYGEKILQFQQQGLDIQREVIDAKDKQRDAIADEVAAVQIQVRRLDYERQIASLSDTQREKALAYFDLKERIVLLGKDPMFEPEQIEQIAKANDELIKMQEQTQRLENTFQIGFDRAFNNFKERAMDSAQAGSDAFNSMANSMEQALDNFVQTGKISFKDLIGSMIKDLLSLQIKAQASGIFSMLGNFAKDMFSSGGVSATAGAYDIFNNPFLNGFADGGNPPVGVPSIVGERGAELFVPKTAGTIIPNHQLSSALGASQQVIYNGTVIQNMSAIDTQSGVQFIAKNKDAIWAANQSANRALPMSR